MGSRRSALIYKKSLICGITAVLVAGLVTGLMGRPTVSDCRPHGQFTYFDAPAPAGTRLQAKIGGQVVADTAVTIAGQYAMSIPPDNEQTTIKDGWAENDIITLWVGSHEARQQFSAFEGSRQIDIVVSSIALDVRRSTWGKIKALFR